eukprot:scaffold4707_cov19-Prasinocladus_malaysianus.AAC.1
MPMLKAQQSHSERSQLLNAYAYAECLCLRSQLAVCPHPSKVESQPTPVAAATRRRIDRQPAIL